MQYLSAVLIFAGFAYVFLIRGVISNALSHTGRFPAFYWRVPEAIFAMSMAGFFLLIALGSIGRPAGKIDFKSLEASLALYGGIIVLILGFLIYRNNDPREAFGLRSREWPSRIGQALGTLVIVLPLIYAAQWFAYFLCGPQSEPQPIVTFLLEHSDMQARLLVIAIAVIAAPLTEELVFRGCLYGVLRQTIGRYAAMAVSALVFALIHAHLPSIPGLIILAIALAVLYESTGSLWAPVILHASFNAASICGAIFWPDLMK